MSTIQWFPGHMNRAKKALLELCDEIDVVLELLDARAPLSSCNPLIQNIIRHKRTIRLLNKSDLADPAMNQIWLKYFASASNTTAILGNKEDKSQRARLIRLCRELAPARGLSFEKPIRVMITGIPNVGKSTLINQLVGKKSAQTGDIPAVTKANQRLYIDDNFVIYDTPGMMWQKIRYPQIGYNLALCNSIGRNALDVEILALYLLEFLIASSHTAALATRYKLTEAQLNLGTDDLFTLIAGKRGCKLAGGGLDRQKASEIIIQDFRGGRLGHISLESPELWERWISEFVLEEEQEEKESDNDA